MDPTSGEERPELPRPTLWPIGFALGVACILVGLVISWVAVAVGAALAVLFGFLWVRDLTGRRAAPAEPKAASVPAPLPGSERFARKKFLEGATLGLGAVIGGVVSVPPLGLLVAPALLGGDDKDIDLGSLDDFPEGKYVIATFVSDPEAGDVSRRTAYVRNNGLREGKPSFTIISNRCAHLGCPVQPNGPVEEKPERVVNDKAGHEVLRLTLTQPANFGCPCHGGSYDIEGNRIAGPPVRALDRYKYAIKNGRLVLRDAYSVGHVEGTGKDARITRYPLHPPGQHVDGPELWLWPIPELK